MLLGDERGGLKNINVAAMGEGISQLLPIVTNAYGDWGGCLLVEQPEIVEAVVVGLADRVRGEVPVAYVVTRCDFSAEDLAARCRAVLASFKVPRAFVAVDKLPRNAMGKIQKHLLPRG